MGNIMGRLILVPQYPTELRYQEWWFKVFPEQLCSAFEEILVLGDHTAGYICRDENFAPIRQALQYEASQIADYINLDLRPDDILLLNDLSFPGLFAQVLLHKRPKKCFAICHATSLNKYDYFEKDRQIKWPIENAISNLFETIFVASNYHARKLSWGNTAVWALPNPPYIGQHNVPKTRPIVSASRVGMQKRTLSIENKIEALFNLKIETANCKTWKEYYTFLAESKILLITAKEETYGYQIVDAIKNDCIPIAPALYSYPELLPSYCLYHSVEELAGIVTRALAGEITVPKLLTENRANSFFKILRNELTNYA